MKYIRRTTREDVQRHIDEEIMSSPKIKVGNSVFRGYWQVTSVYTRRILMAYASLMDKKEATFEYIKIPLDMVFIKKSEFKRSKVEICSLLNGIVEDKVEILENRILDNYRGKDKEEIQNMHVFTIFEGACTYLGDEDCICVSPNQKLWKYFNNIDKDKFGYTLFEWIEYQLLPTSIAQSFYSYVKSYEYMDTEKYKGRICNHQKLEKLKSFLKYMDLEDYVGNVDILKRKKLQPAYNQIQKFTKLKFKFEFCKKEGTRNYTHFLVQFKGYEEWYKKLPTDAQEEERKKRYEQPTGKIIMAQEGLSEYYSSRKII